MPYASLLCVAIQTALVAVMNNLTLACHFCYFGKLSAPPPPNQAKLACRCTQMYVSSHYTNTYSVTYVASLVVDSHDYQPSHNDVLSRHHTYIIVDQ